MRLGIIADTRNTAGYGRYGADTYRKVARLCAHIAADIVREAEG